jgi:Zc3h12a-like Ribonuclease NYN domain
MLVPFGLPFGQTFLVPPEAPGWSLTGEPAVILLAGLLGLAFLWLLLRPSPERRRRRPSPRSARKPAATRPSVLIDGSNVMHWKDERPDIHPVRATVALLHSRGQVPGVIFDANAGYKLSGRYMGEKDLGKLLGLPADQIFVVPKGTQADPYLLTAAREYGVRVVTRDRFRDWAAEFPEVTTPGFLLRGGYRDTGAFWLDETVSANNLV